MYYEIERWLMIAGIFCAGMLSMLGVMIWVDMAKRARKPRVPLGRGFDTRNPINSRSVLNDQYRAEEQEDGWYEVRGNW